MIDGYAESDEAFARRLQAQEDLGTNQGNNNVDAQTPLMNRPDGNPTVINARLNEVNTSRIALYVIFAANIPQVLATIIVLCMHWDDPNVCDVSHSLRWKLWAIFSAARMLTYSLVVLFIDIYRSWLQERREYSDRVRSLRNTIDACGLIWFVVGNMWLFGDDDDSCAHPEKSPVYNLCVAMLVINYIQICMPCILAILLIPVFCFCMPCLIRVLARLQDPHASTGATDAAIDTLPEVVIDSSHLPAGQDHTCPICLNELSVGEAARVLRCKHVFHKQCVDEWLRVNASCPTCRKRIFDNSEHSSDDINSNNDSGGGGNTQSAAVVTNPSNPGTGTAGTGTAGTGTAGTGASAGTIRSGLSRPSVASSNNGSNAGGGGSSSTPSQGGSQRSLPYLLSGTHPPSVTGAGGAGGAAFASASASASANPSRGINSRDVQDDGGADRDVEMGPVNPSTSLLDRR